MVGNSTDTESARELLCFMGLEPRVDLAKSTIIVRCCRNVRIRSELD